jgi:H+/Cl- antiporter ClcA
LAGGLYNITYKKISTLFRRSQGLIIPKVLTGSFLAFSLAYLVNPLLLGTSRGIFSALSRGELSVIFANLPTLGHGALALLIIVAVKVLSNCLTVGSGMNAGFTGPALLTGMLLGASASLFLGLEVGSATYHAFLAAGFAGMLASTVNVPLAAAVLAVEVFGLSYSFPSGLSAIIGFQMMRSSFLYDSGGRKKSNESPIP